MKAIATSAAMVSVLTLLAAALPAAGQETSTLKKIRATNSITIGHRDVSMPFSYLDDEKRPIGYSIDLCMRIVDAIKSSLNLPKLEIRTQVVTSATRIPLIANGTIDLECGSTTNTTERQQQVSFVVTTFVAATRLAWKTSGNFRSVADLKGKTVVAVAGTTNLKQMTQLNLQRGLNMTLAPAKDNAMAFAMVEKGSAAAFVTDDILLHALVATAAKPAEYAISSESFSVEPYGIMVRRNDPQFKKLADDTIVGLFRSGEIHAIYDKWFLAPIPPKGIKLNKPMSESLKKVIANPTDSGNPGDY